MPPCNFDYSTSTTYSIHDSISKNLDIIKGNTEQINGSYYIVNEKVVDELSRWQVLNTIRKCAVKKKGGCWSPLNLYYSGYGERGTGNWCFSDGTVSLKEVLDTIQSVNHYNKKKIKRIVIYSDCSYSGNWTDDLRKYKQLNTTNLSITINAACDSGFRAWDTPKGAMFTLGQFEDDILTKIGEPSFCDSNTAIMQSQ